MGYGGINITNSVYGGKSKIKHLNDGSKSHIKRDDDNKVSVMLSGIFGIIYRTGGYKNVLTSEPCTWSVYECGGK